MKYTEYKLVIAGGTDHVTPFTNRIMFNAEENDVVTPGFVTGEDLNQLYTFAGIFVLPSYNEGLPISLLEAMSYNLPVIASDIPANTEIGLPDECYFPVGDEHALAEHLSQAITKEPQPIFYDLKKYNWNHIAEQVVVVYEELL
jgi:glycosyltransferase involved in cell wall biosynthesis